MSQPISNQNDAVDTSFRKFEALLKDVADFGETLFTESDSRIKIIDSVLIDVLGWHKSQISTSEQAGPGFLDYKLSIGNLAKVIVEAKRESRPFDLKSRECGGAFQLSGPIFRNADLQEGIEQAVRYSAHKGAELACVTNGREWIVFRSNRLGDGLDVLSGKAFVFPSLECIRDWACFGKTDREVGTFG
ncbi:MAG TPA: hypothetical protein VK615_10835 [Candidatus Binatia bacterium]|nr:hypothetical protein [Candidatus Binatia bacterium]